MQRFGKHSAAAQRQAERRQLENDAPRLAIEAPELLTLRLEIEEHSQIAAVGPNYLRLISVAHAPALFLLPCGDNSCADGGHDITHEIMRSIKARQTSFKGDDACRGSLGQSGSCTRILHYVATATYK